MRRYLLILLGVTLLQSCGMTPALAHDPYTKWEQSNGVSCCNKTDCGPAKARWTPTGWQVLLRGRWCAVPSEKVRPYPSPDGGPHVCASPSGTGCQMYCFVRGESKG